MQVAAVSPRPFPHLPSQLRALTCCGALILAAPLAARAANNFLLVDTQTITTLQLRAQQASPRDQVQLYADLADKISMLANQQILQGDLEQAEHTLHQLEACTLVIETNLQRDSRGLKKTEMLLHTTNRRLADMMRAASGDMKPVVQNALKRLDSAQTALLSAVFQH